MPPPNNNNNNKNQIKKKTNVKVTPQAVKPRILHAHRGVNCQSQTTPPKKNKNNTLFYHLF